MFLEGPSGSRGYFDLKHMSLLSTEKGTSSSSGFLGFIPKVYLRAAAVGYSLVNCVCERFLSSTLSR